MNILDLPESIDDARSALFNVDNVCQKQVAMVIEKIKDSGKYNSKEEEEKVRKRFFFYIKKRD